MHRKRLREEKAEVFAYKIQLVKNAYPSFDDGAKKALAKDFYVKGLSTETQKDLRKLTDFENKSLDDLVKHTTYVEIANANATTSQTQPEVVAMTSSETWTHGRVVS